MAHVLVVGGGLAGARMCLTLRSAGFGGRVTLVAGEPEPPYDRPPLTKDPTAELDLRATAGLDVWSAADEVLLGCRASALAPAGAGIRVGLGDRDLLADAVVIATGAAAVLPPGWEQPGVHVLRTAADGRRFWPRVGPGRRVLVVGGGWIGCEAAATAAALGARVRLVEAAGQLLAADLPAAAADRVAGWLAEAGVAVELGATVARLSGTPFGPVRARAGGRELDVDVVLVGAGMQPTTEWVAGSGVTRGPSGAVLVDPWGRTSTPGVFAVGDAAARWSTRLGRHLPGGHWTEALDAPQDVAVAVVDWMAQGPGHDGRWQQPPGIVPDPVRYVFSQIGGRTLQVLGDPGAAAPGGRVVWREQGPGWSAFTLDGHDRLLGVASAGRPRDIAASRRATRASSAVGPAADAAALADPTAGPAAMFGGARAGAGG